MAVDNDIEITHKGQELYSKYWGGFDGLEEIWGQKNPWWLPDNGGSIAEEDCFSLQELEHAYQQLAQTKYSFLTQIFKDACQVLKAHPDATAIVYHGW